MLHLLLLGATLASMCSTCGKVVSACRQERLRRWAGPLGVRHRTCSLAFAPAAAAYMVASIAPRPHQDILLVLSRRSVPTEVLGWGSCLIFQRRRLMMNICTRCLCSALCMLFSPCISRQIIGGPGVYSTLVVTGQLLWLCLSYPRLYCRWYWCRLDRQMPSTCLLCSCF